MIEVEAVLKELLNAYRSSQRVDKEIGVVRQATGPSTAPSFQFLLSRIRRRLPRF